MTKSHDVLVRSVLIFVGLMTIAPTWAIAQGATGDAPPVPYASVNELNGILTQLQQTAQSMQADLSSQLTGSNSAGWFGERRQTPTWTSQSGG